MLNKTAGGAADRRIEAYNAAINALLVFYAPDVVCHPAPGWVGDELCYGHDGIRMLSAVGAQGVSEPTIAVDSVRDLNERMLVLARLTGRDPVSGARVEQQFALLNSDLREDLRVGEVHFFLGWDEGLAAAGLVN